MASIRIPSLAFLCALGVLSGEHALAQDLTPRAVPQDKTVLIVNAVVHPISTPAIPCGFVVFSEGQIRQVGALSKMPEHSAPRGAATPSSPPEKLVPKTDVSSPASNAPTSDPQEIIRRMRDAARAQGINTQSPQLTGTNTITADPSGDGETHFEFKESVPLISLLLYLSDELKMTPDFEDGDLAGCKVWLDGSITLRTPDVMTVFRAALQESGYTLTKDDAAGKLVLRRANRGGPPPIPADIRIIDAKGKHVYPGLIGVFTQLGLTEIQSVRAMSDFAETGGITPEVRAVTAVNPDSTLLPVTRSAGEMIAGVFPSGGSMPGRAGVIRLDGWTVADMTIRDDAGLVVNWPIARTINAPWMNQSEDEQRRGNDKNLRAIEDMLTGAKAYAAAKAAGKQTTTDIRYEAMLGLWAGVLARESGVSPLSKSVTVEMEITDTKVAAKGLMPVFIHAQDYDQIQQAVTVCAKHGLKCVIIGGRDAPLCADLLKRHNVSVIVDGTFKFPKRDDAPYDDAYTLPARLEAAGIKWCLASGEETAHERNLSNAAGMAVAYGLDHEAGLRSITLSSAEALGIADKYGSIAMDKSATLIVTDGDVLDVMSHVTMAFLDGREVNLSDKQKVLNERYRGKYKLDGATPTGAGSGAAAPRSK